MAYTLYLVFVATSNPALSTFNQIMVYGALPLTAIGLLIVSMRQLRLAKA